MKIAKYSVENEDDVLSAIGTDPDWVFLIHGDKRDMYKKSLLHGVSYVCYSNNEFCGYVRAIHDTGFSLYISELFVTPKWRNQKIGQLLLEQFKHDFPELTIYVFSDEDAYYVKKGYKRIGSVFEL